MNTSGNIEVSTKNCNERRTAVSVGRTSLKLVTDS